jgi:hypothetical protein
MSNTSNIKPLPKGFPIIDDATVSTRKILIVPIKTIKHTPYNPAGRTKEGQKLKNLIESIRERGMVYPILITDGRDVIDGNRRLAACRALGHESIECVVSGLDRDEAFTAVNTTAVPIGGKGWLEIGMGGGYLPPKEAAQYHELRTLIGSYGVDLLIHQNLGLNILPLCKSIAALGIEKTLEELILLTAANKLTNKLNFELRAQKEKEKKIEAINELLRGIVK